MWLPWRCIQTRLTQQIRPYMQEHHLKEDTVFTKYVKDLLERSMGLTSFYGEAPWEAKVITVIGCIKDPRSKCEAILEMMKMAHIPLSAQIEKLIQEGMELEHPKSVYTVYQLYLTDAFFCYVVIKMSSMTFVMILICIFL
ncbi:kinetochore-associated protein 1-like [Saccostrea cucullata]|uniref:kinetochore-associated protein 1-like n=1 Tax=Saccostrea cuccullata TaxID=36930 RepID=UPI002ED654C7